MEVKCFVNGEEIERDPFDLDYIEVDIVKDFVREIEKLENNPTARVEVDMTSPEKPAYHLVNCNNHFESQFFDMVQRKNLPD
jgi:hypothetical protein